MVWHKTIPVLLVRCSQWKRAPTMGSGHAWSWYQSVSKPNKIEYRIWWVHGIVISPVFCRKYHASKLCIALQTAVLQVLSRAPPVAWRQFAPAVDAAQQRSGVQSIWSIRETIRETIRAQWWPGHFGLNLIFILVFILYWYKINMSQSILMRVLWFRIESKSERWQIRHWPVNINLLLMPHTGFVIRTEAKFCSFTCLKRQLILIHHNHHNQMHAARLPLAVPMPLHDLVYSWMMLDDNSPK